MAMHPELGDVLKARLWQQQRDHAVAEVLGFMHLGSNYLQQVQQQMEEHR
jgi:hypothetical protein